MARAGRARGGRRDRPQGGQAGLVDKADVLSQSTRGASCVLGWRGGLVICFSLLAWICSVCAVFHQPYVSPLPNTTPCPGGMIINACGITRPLGILRHGALEAWPGT